MIQVVFSVEDGDTILLLKAAMPQATVCSQSVARLDSQCLSNSIESAGASEHQCIVYSGTTQYDVEVC